MLHVSYLVYRLEYKVKRTNQVGEYNNCFIVTAGFMVNNLCPRAPPLELDGPYIQVPVTYLCEGDKPP